jgi:hypothetical protein
MFCPSSWKCVLVKMKMKRRKKNWAVRIKWVWREKSEKFMCILHDGRQKCFNFFLFKLCYNSFRKCEREKIDRENENKCKGRIFVRCLSRKKARQKIKAQSIRIHLYSPTTRLNNNLVYVHEIKAKKIVS